MQRESGTDEAGNKWFEFIADHFKPPVRVTWRGAGALVNPVYLRTLLANRFARNLTDEEAEAAEIDSDAAPEEAQTDNADPEEQKAAEATLAAKAEAEANAETLVIPAQPQAPVGLQPQNASAVQAALEKLAEEKAQAPAASKSKPAPK